MYNYPNYNQAQSNFYQSNMQQAVQPMVSQMMQQGQAPMYGQQGQMQNNGMQSMNGMQPMQSPMVNSGFTNPMPITQPYQAQQAQQMIVRPVTGVEEAKAAIIDPVSTNMFPDFSHNSIYVKKINNNGMPEFYTFSLQMEEEKPDPFIAINERLDRIESAVSSSYTSNYNFKEDGLNVSTNSGDARNTANVGRTINAGDSANVGNDGNAGNGTAKSNGNANKK